MQPNSQCGKWDILWSSYIFKIAPAMMLSFCVRTGMMASICSRKLQYCLKWKGKPHISRPWTVSHSHLTREHMPVPFMVKKTVMYENLCPSVFLAGRSASLASAAGLKCNVSQWASEYQHSFPFCMETALLADKAISRQKYWHFYRIVFGKDQHVTLNSTYGRGQIVFLLCKMLE